MGISQDLERLEVDGRQFVAQVAKAVVQQAPGGGRLAMARFTDQEKCPAVALERRSVQEEKAGPDLLNRQEDRLLQREDEAAEVWRPEGCSVPRAKDESGRVLEGDVVAQRALELRAISGESLVVRTQDDRGDGVVAGNFDSLTDDAQVQARGAQSGHRAVRDGRDAAD